MPPKKKPRQVEYIVREPTRLFGEERATYDVHSDTATYQKIIRQGQYLSVHKASLALFGWVEAHLLCQLDFYISKSKGKERLKVDQRRRWVEKSHEQWCQELPPCSRSTLKRAIKRLEDAGVILSDREPWRKRYSINYEAWAYFLHNPEAFEKYK